MTEILFLHHFFFILPTTIYLSLLPVYRYKSEKTGLNAKYNVDNREYEKTISQVLDIS